MPIGTTTMGLSTRESAWEDAASESGTSTRLQPE